MFKKLFLSTLLLATTATHAQYFYFWAEDYTATTDVDGSVLCKITVDGTDHNLKLHGIVNENFLIF